MRDSPRFLLAAATYEAGRGGIARVARLSARALADVDVRALSLLDCAPTEIDGVRTLPAIGGQAGLAARCWLAAPFRTHFIYDSAGLARAHPRLAGLRRPSLVWMHGLEAWEALRPDRARAFARADLVLVNSHHTLGRYQALHGPLPQARVCWLATEEDEPGPRADFQPTPTVLILGRMEPGESHKGHREVIAAWPEVVKAVPDARLLIVGRGDGVGRVRALAAASSASAAIEVAGYVPEAGIEAVWRRARVLALPSRGEGFGLVYVEAMRRGLACIASVHDAGREVNADGLSGFNVDLDQPGDLAQALVRLLRSPELAAWMGAEAQARWAAHFRFSAFRTRFGAALAPLLDRSGWRRRRHRPG